MAFCSIKSSNIRLTISDECADIDGEECFFEIVVSKNFLKRMFEVSQTKTGRISLSGIRLTKRELQVLKFLSDGLNNSEIADKLCVSIHTVKVHIGNIYRKLYVQDRTGAVIKAIRDGLIEI